MKCSGLLLPFSLAVGFALVGCGQSSQTSDLNANQVELPARVTKLPSEAEFNKYLAGHQEGIVVMSVGADPCGPCLRLKANLVNHLAKDTTDHLYAYAQDSFNAPSFSKEFYDKYFPGNASIPQFMVIKDGVFFVVTPRLPANIPSGSAEAAAYSPENWDLKFLVKRGIDGVDAKTAAAKNPSKTQPATKS